MLGTVRTLIVDEIHAVIGNRRGSHLALSMERLAALVSGPLQRIGLSATQKPIEQVARFHADCGHSFQSYEVKRAAVAGVSSAVLCCPMCSYVVSIYTPYTLLDQQAVILG